MIRNIYDWAELTLIHISQHNACLLLNAFVFSLSQFRI